MSDKPQIEVGKYRSTRQSYIGASVDIHAHRVIVELDSRGRVSIAAFSSDEDDAYQKERNFKWDTETQSWDEI